MNSTKPRAERCVKLTSRWSATATARFGGNSSVTRSFEHKERQEVLRRVKVWENELERSANGSGFVLWVQWSHVTTRHYCDDVFGHNATA